MEIVGKLAKKPRKLRKKLIIILLAFILLFSFCIHFIKRRINPNIIDICSSRINLLANEAINDAIIESYASFENIDFVSVVRDEKGNVSSVQSDVKKINEMCNIVIRACNQKMLAFGESGVDVSFGAILGMPIFMGLGPKVNFKFSPFGSLDYDVRTEVISAGINQTVHKVYLKINANVKLMYSSVNPIIAVSNEVLIGETVIVGAVPNLMLTRGII